jgi:transcriptional regulator GlxA family with amidase domain
VDLRPESLITDEGTLICGGGAFSYFDLSLYLVERYCGFEIAAQCGKSLLLDLGRTSQVPYAVFEFQKQHKDMQILRAQTFVEKNFTQPVTMDDLAARVGMSVRNFKRRFRSATGDSPLTYVQRFRVEAAKRLFENTYKSISEVCYQVGYEDIAFFRRIFKRYVGIAPHEYRKRLQPR